MLASESQLLNFGESCKLVVKPLLFEINRAISGDLHHGNQKTLQIRAPLPSLAPIQLHVEVAEGMFVPFSFLSWLRSLL